MKCVTCGNEVSNNEQVCPICGTSKAANVQSQEMHEMQNSASGSYCTMCGRPIPDGYKMGYAGDLITNGRITVNDKIQAMRQAGITVVDNINDIHKELIKVAK